MRREPIVAFPDESCRSAAEKMAQSGAGRLPVVGDPGATRVVGMVTRSDLLKPRARAVEAEQQRERFLGLRRRAHTKHQRAIHPR